MDLIVAGIVALVVAIMSVLVAVIARKKLGKILIYGILGLIAGLPIGYFLAPAIISFF